MQDTSFKKYSWIEYRVFPFLNWFPFCCIQGRTITTLRYENIICFFSSFSFITRNVGKGRLRASRRWLKCTHTGATVRFYVKLCSSRVEIISRFILFSGCPRNPRSHPSFWHATHIIHVIFPPCFFFTWRHRCISCWYPRNLRGLLKIKYLTLQRLKISVSPTIYSEGEREQRDSC